MLLLLSLLVFETESHITKVEYITRDDLETLINTLVMIEPRSTTQSGLLERSRLSWTVIKLTIEIVQNPQEIAVVNRSQGPLGYRKQAEVLSNSALCLVWFYFEVRPYYVAMDALVLSIYPRVASNQSNPPTSAFLMLELKVWTTTP